MNRHTFVLEQRAEPDFPPDFSVTFVIDDADATGDDGQIARSTLAKLLSLECLNAATVRVMIADRDLGEFVLRSSLCEAVG